MKRRSSLAGLRPHCRRVDEFPAGLFLDTVCSPAWPASASPASRSVRSSCLAGNQNPVNGNPSLAFQAVSGEGCTPDGHLSDFRSDGLARQNRARSFVEIRGNPGNPGQTGIYRIARSAACAASVLLPFVGRLGAARLKRSPEVGLDPSVEVVQAEPTSTSGLSQRNRYFLPSFIVGALSPCTHLLRTRARTPVAPAEP